MPNAYFENNSFLIKLVQHFESSLSLCLGCRLMWFSDYNRKNGAKWSELDLKILACCIDNLNKLQPSVEQLASWKVFISHGICRSCMREKMVARYRTSQKGAGYHPCYATAVDGHCSQYECAYYDCCVVDQSELCNWAERKKKTSLEEQRETSRISHNSSPPPPGPRVKTLNKNRRV
jgi:hypothetical protein